LSGQVFRLICDEPSAGEVGGEAMRESNGRFIRGHGKLGGFVKGSHHKPESKLLVSESLRAKFADEARRWRGDGASYAAKHMWISKHYGKARKCENDSYHVARRYEWANISGQYKREREDCKQLCPSCHRRMDMKDMCRQGHLYTKTNTHVNSRGHRRCITCWEERKRMNAAAN
jgi:hypothetical protein